MCSLLVTDVFSVCVCVCVCVRARLTHSLSCDKTQSCRLDIDLADPPSGPMSICLRVFVCTQAGRFMCSSLHPPFQVSFIKNRHIEDYKDKSVELKLKLI